MELYEIRDILSQASIFTGLDNAQKTLLADNCHLKQYNAGVEVIKEGSSGDGLYIIVEGKLNVFLPETSSLGEDRFSKVKLNTLVAGDCFGEYSLIDKNHVSATIEVIEHARILKIDKGDFEKITESDLRLTNIIYYNLLNMLINRLRKHDEELDQFVIY